MSPNVNFPLVVNDNKETKSISPGILEDIGAKLKTKYSPNKSLFSDQFSFNELFNSPETECVIMIDN